MVTRESSLHQVADVQTTCLISVIPQVKPEEGPVPEVEDQVEDPEEDRVEATVILAQIQDVPGLSTVCPATAGIQVYARAFLKLGANGVTGPRIVITTANPVIFARSIVAGFASATAERLL